MNRSERIRLARRRAALSQEALAAKLQVNRSAIANWEAGISSPNGTNLERLAAQLEVSYEWLATGRGEMKLPCHWHEVPALDAELVESPYERRLLKAWRSLPAKARVLTLELVESYPTAR
ncbi:MAG: helix-turn-helix domain-containing protein [Lysobacteraceae bacterium]